MISFHDWYYALPQLGYLLLAVIPMIFLFRSLLHHRQKVLQTLINSSHIHQLSSRQSRLSSWLRGISLCLVWMLCCLALMDPIGNLRYLSTGQEKASQNQWVLRPRELIFLIDASASMSATDTRSNKSRLEIAKEITNELITHLEGQNGSLYAFTSDLTTLSPPTLDYLFLILALRDLSINEGGTAGTDVATALQHLHKISWGVPSNKEYTLVILSDGEDTVLEGLQGNERSQAREKIMDPLKNALDSHLRVFTIGIGSAAGAPVPGLTFEGKPVVTHLHEELLKDISLIGRGKYYSAATASTLEILQALLDEFNADLLEAQKRQQPLLSTQTEETTRYDLYYQIPLGLALLLLASLLFCFNRAHRFDMGV